MTISLSIALIISLIIALVASYFIIQAVKNGSSEFGNFSVLFIIFILIVSGFALYLNWIIYFVIN
jgi:hypothetical protein